jgi:hypothetical protein
MSHDVSGKVIVNRCMSLDGFIAGPGDSMDCGDSAPTPSSHLQDARSAPTSGSTSGGTANSNRP